MLVRALLTLFAAALFCAPIHAGTIAVPAGVVTVDGQSYPVGLELDPESGMYAMSLSVDVPGQYRISLSGVADPDPQIAYGFAVTDFGAPSTFGFAFTSPIVLTNGPTEIESSLNAALTDFTGDGVSLSIPGFVTDTDGDGILEMQEALANGGNLGIDVGPAASFGPGAPGALYTYGPHVEPEQFGPVVGVFTTLSLDLDFTLSGGGDIAAFTGFLRLDETDGIIPEPSTWLMGAIGGAFLLGRGVYRRRR